MSHIFTGFGFGPIQSGLFAAEAFKSGNFERIIIAEIDQKLVDAVRQNKGTYYVNVACEDRIITEKIEGIEIYNPKVQEDRKKIINAIAESTEIVTSLPSVDFYDMGENSVASLIAQGLSGNKRQGCIIYAAENNNEAAEILRSKIKSKGELKNNVQFLNTVIGKMSGVKTDPEEIKKADLKTITPDFERAFLVEEFHHILVTKTSLDNFEPGIKVFMEKENLLPFEEAKLYGHNAIHALLAYLGYVKGYEKMSDLRKDSELMSIAEKAFLEESGEALCKKYESLNDHLFTEEGYREFALDLLGRMTNPYLTDTVERTGRDPKRKLGINDRLFGTMQLALYFGIEPVNLAKGAKAGMIYAVEHLEELQKKFNVITRNGLTPTLIEKILFDIWSDNIQKDKAEKLIALVKSSE